MPRGTSRPIAPRRFRRQINRNETEMVMERAYPLCEQSAAAQANKNFANFHAGVEKAVRFQVVGLLFANDSRKIREFANEPERPGVFREGRRHRKSGREDTMTWQHRIETLRHPTSGGVRPL